ncbi:MAG: peroxidase family protein [Gammaproteobacteria bacterium]|nr:peroxidase family protein [Gammaproteobacteria bacterium]MDH5653143.1 peroxidase family protein [Gammaproteobacteria bacterium]
MKQNLKDLLLPIVNWYTGSTAVEVSSLSKFSQQEAQLEELKLFLDIMFDAEDLDQHFKPKEIQAIRHFYRHVDELDLWHVMTNPKSVKSIATSENIDLKKLKAMAKELLDLLKGKIV